MASAKTPKETPQDHNCMECTKGCNSILSHLMKEDLHEFNEQKSENSYKRGQVVFNEGNIPLGLYCIARGKVKVHHRGQDGKDQIVRLAKSGDLLGYRALLASERYNASATTLDECDICFIPKETFFAALKTNPELSFEIIKLLTKELKQAELMITDLAQKPVRERMLEALLFLKETYGFEEDGETINATLSREDISNLVGTATENAIRLLSEFKRDGMLSFEGKKIKIINMQKLLHQANLYN